MRLGANPGAATGIRQRVTVHPPGNAKIKTKRCSGHIVVTKLPNETQEWSPREVRATWTGSPKGEHRGHANHQRPLARASLTWNGDVFTRRTRLRSGQWLAASFG